MTTPSSGDPEPVDLGKSGSSSGEDGQEPFDPYRFGRPEHPVPPEYAPPGYVPDAPPQGPPPVPPGGYPPPPAWGQGGGPQGGPQRGPQGQYPPYGQPGYPPPPPYGQQYGPHYGPHYGPQYGRGSNGKATTALVLGILSIVFCWLVFFDALLVVPAIIFGILGLGEAKRSGTGRGMAIAGIVCAAVAAVLAVVFTVVVFHAAGKCGGFGNGDDPGFRTCVQDQFR